ncbi:MAG: hypothetical protein CVT69_01900 [Actinobacteria bacterium HGW-Actinobacteria-9]|jgi:DegV family protein with EDD domain|nr:MAG: hypothetical protein CVT69_01900 [Actinobacteria bacterium HGW-Actinobacteria-9]
MQNETPRVAVVTDSCSDIDPRIASEYGITVVPLTVTFGDESMPDGTLTQKEFFQKMDESAVLPTTSQPSVGQFVDTYARLLETAEEIVSVHISAKLSGTLESATQAAAQFAEKVHVVDTFNLSWGEGLQVLEAAKAATRGETAKSIVERVHRARDRVQMLVGVDSLDQMVKGGRISRVGGAVGGALNVKILVTPKDGKLTVARPVRGARQALEYGVKWIEQKMNGARAGTFAVMHAMSQDNAAWFERAIRERFVVNDLYMVEVGAVIATHTGPGWGVALLPEE